jgi:hypothetical protein
MDKTQDIDETWRSGKSILFCANEDAAKNNWKGRQMYQKGRAQSAFREWEGIGKGH